MKERFRETDLPADSGEEKRPEESGSGELSGDTGEMLLVDSPEKYRSAEEMTEYGRDVAETTKQNLMAQQGERMGEANLQRLEAHDTRGRVEVLDYQDFHERFPNAQPGVIGLYHNGTVYAVNGHQDMVTHTLTHETAHLCSHKAETFTENGDGSRQHVYASGLLRVETSVDPDGVRHTSVSNRALNEGLTEMYTIRELTSRGDWQAANAYQAYSPQRGYCSRLEGILDPGTLESAYYGGNLDGLRGNVERLTGDPGAFDRISMNLSALDNPEQAEAAREALENDFMAMSEARFAEISAEAGTFDGFGTETAETGGAGEIGGTGGGAAEIGGGDSGTGGDLGTGGDTGSGGDAGDTGGDSGGDDEE